MLQLATWMLQLAKWTLQLRPHPTRTQRAAGANC
jgi:hypothetical protein